MKKKFIVFEGIDASGKSIVSKIVSDKLSMEHVESPTEDFQKTRKYIEDNSEPICRFLFYISSNIDLSRIIKRKIQDNDIICARYYFSTLIGYSYPLSKSIEGLLESVSIRHDDFYQPDLTILLHVNSSKQIDRLNKRNDNFGSDTRCLTDKTYNNDMMEKYITVAKKYNWVIIDTSDMSIDEVVQQSIFAIKKI